ncbi:MAG: hypothetical protein JST82_00330 [Bacteroidetes bacterium]|nr:hypothetical protein [Bacteroidota bacterium]MBS1771273.1 hypothetical protein [Bacteroidota bacterium]
MLAPKLLLKQRSPLVPKNNQKNQNISSTVAKVNLAKNATIAMVVEAVTGVLAGAALPVLTR